VCDICGCAATAAHLEPGLAEPGHAHEDSRILGRLLDANDRAARHNQAHFDSHGVAVFNLMSSPGAGKTALLEATIDALGHEFRIAVIEGDLETDNDARRIRAHGVPAVQISTGGACHLDARMVHGALHDLALDGLDIVFIENVGNLVCPASFDLGQHRNVVLLSVTEGDDKPAKYPIIFRAADAVLVTKMDFAAALEDFDPARAEQAIRNLANPAPVIAVAARRAPDISSWIAWLSGEVEAIRRDAASAAVERSHDHRSPVA
jgi:hydrogenase nickel incorporation protein HypB